MGSEEMKNYDEIITQTSANYADVDQQVLIANSENLWVQDHRVRSRIFLNAVATHGSEMQTGYSAPGLSKGFEFLRELDIKALAGCEPGPEPIPDLENTTETNPNHSDRRRPRHQRPADGPALRSWRR